MGTSRASEKKQVNIKGLIEGLVTEVFQYTTSSTSLQKKLGVAPERPAAAARAAAPERVAP